jgi:FKBP-type peptidyl-prolyl cis-trans isomerase FkpA
MRKGIKIDELQLGEGPLAQKGKVVTIRYTGCLRRGDKFQEDLTCTFKVGSREVIAGLERGVEGMHVGGKRRIRVSPHLAYGDEGVEGTIPPNAVLLFEVELLEVREGM